MTAEGLLEIDDKTSIPAFADAIATRQADILFSGTLTMTDRSVKYGT
jgi:hypothetical protein